jgi:hypothetical protein
MNFCDTRSKECDAISALLSEYADNTLSGRQVWAVESHLVGCRVCTEDCENLKKTVTLIREAPRFDTSNDFMARIHARLDSLEPEAFVKPSPLQTLWEGLVALRASRRVPVVGLGVAMVALFSFALLRPAHAPKPAQIVAAEARALVSEPLRQSVALATRDPFEDPAAANLEANAVLNESSGAKPRTP